MYNFWVNRQSDSPNGPYLEPNWGKLGDKSVNNYVQYRGYKSVSNPRENTALIP